MQNYNFLPMFFIILLSSRNEPIALSEVKELNKICKIKKIKKSIELIIRAWLKQTTRWNNHWLHGFEPDPLIMKILNQPSGGMTGHNMIWTFSSFRI